MKKAVSHIAILFLAATVLFSSTGVSVHQFYCMCMGEMTASIFKPGDPCDAEVWENMADCCKSKLSDEARQCDGKKDCSDCTSKYVHLDADYLLFSVQFELNTPPVLPAAKYFVEQKFIVKKSIPVWENDLPPPPYGKSLLPHIQSFLC